MDFTFIILLGILVVGCVVGVVVFLSSKHSRKHLTYEFKGHKIEVRDFMTHSEFWVDGKMEDSIQHPGPGSYHCEFTKKFDKDVVKVTTDTMQVIKLYVNDEKQDIEY